MPKDNSTVKVHYTPSKLIDGTVFDSSVDRGEPADFPVTQVIPGFSEGLKMMNKGSKYVLYIPASLGYGNNEVKQHSGRIYSRVRGRDDRGQLISPSGRHGLPLT